jgi:hypothetical protein
MYTPSCGFTEYPWLVLSLMLARLVTSHFCKVSEINEILRIDKQRFDRIYSCILLRARSSIAV